MANINKKLVASRFGSKVNSYDIATPVQERMAQTLIEQVGKYFSAGEPGRILELGCGTGRLTRKIVEIFPNTRITAVDISSQMTEATLANCHNVDVILADAESYICDLSEPYDLIISNAAVQWFRNIEETLGHAYRLLSDGGLLAIATFGENTFCELRESFDMAYAGTGRKKINHVIDIYPIYKLHANFPKAEIVQENIKQYFNDVRTFLRSIQDAGAVNSTDNKRPLNRHVLQEMCRQYSCGFTNADSGKITATYHICYMYLSSENKGYSP